MKRVDLLRHLEAHGGEFLREGGNHTIYVNRAVRTSSAIPRHREINDLLAGRYVGICKCLNREIERHSHPKRRHTILPEDRGGVPVQLLIVECVIGEAGRVEV